MVSACVTQYYIYKMSPCGKRINELTHAGKDCSADISVWVQVFPFGLIGMSEVLASITKLEYVYIHSDVGLLTNLYQIRVHQSPSQHAIHRPRHCPFHLGRILCAWPSSSRPLRGPASGVELWKRCCRRHDRRYRILVYLPQSRSRRGQAEQLEGVKLHRQRRKT